MVCLVWRSSGGGTHRGVYGLRDSRVGSPVVAFNAKGSPLAIRELPWHNTSALAARCDTGAVTACNAKVAMSRPLVRD